MRLVHFLVGSQEGGAEEFFMKLIEAQHEAGEDLLVILGPNEARQARLEEMGVAHLVLSFEGFYRDFQSRRKMAHSLAAFRPHVVQCWMSRAGRRTRQGPYVTVGRCGGYYPVKHYNGCDHLIANTPGILDFIRADGWPQEQAHLISNFGSLKPAADIVRSELDTGEDAKIILAMGRLDQSKGFDLLIEALCELPSPYVVWLAGVGPDEAALRSLAEQRGLSDRVQFLGWRDDTAALYEQADVYVMSSRNEPLGNVVLEAFYAGVPVVALKSPGPEWIVTDGHDGLLVEQGDVAALARSIEKAATDEALRAELVANAKATYEARFSKAAILEQYKDFYEAAYQEKFGREIET